MSISLKSDCSVAGAVACADAFAWDSTEAKEAAVRALVPIIRSTLEAYDHFKKQQARRLRPLETPKEEDQDRATE